MERLYALQFAAAGDHLALAMHGVPLLEARDGRYRSGGAGFVIDEGTMLADGFGVVERVVEEICSPVDAVDAVDVTTAKLRYSWLSENEMGYVLLNLLYAVVGGGTVIAFMFLGYRVIDHVTPFDTAEQLHAGNVAVGIMVGGMFVGIGIAVGLVVGMGLN